MRPADVDLDRLSQLAGSMEALGAAASAELIRQAAEEIARRRPAPAAVEPAASEGMPLRPGGIWKPNFDESELTLTLDGQRLGGVVVYTCNRTGAVVWFGAIVATPEGDRELKPFFDTMDGACTATEQAAGVAGRRWDGWETPGSIVPTKVAAHA
jgi:hypothetical protein